ncbi:hypothetical protein DS831_06115 [Bombilactobacillus bombi]|uniref:Holin n=1 Tax=Bombilactobacillus bombi TaxID=1303590 RepID=A0A417ZER9_9LACO|nr:holin [Bombilactobacillus bombi]RHW49735.1 hypothetical protein DS831_06115 [Bombilactobacillus bombi]
MDFINQLNLGSGLEIVIITAICYGVTQAIKQTNIGKHWLPWFSMVTGIIAGEMAGMSQGDSHYLSLGILGLLIGAATAGLFDGFKAPSVALKNKATLTDSTSFNTNQDNELSKPISADWKPTDEQQQSMKDDNAHTWKVAKGDDFHAANQ